MVFGSEKLKRPTAAVPEGFSEYPKFVRPHASHVVYDPRSGRPHAEKWEYHVDRDDVVTVMVHDAAEEHMALSKVAEEKGHIQW